MIHWLYFGIQHGITVRMIHKQLHAGPNRRSDRICHKGSVCVRLGDEVRSVGVVVSMVYCEECRYSTT